MQSALRLTVAGLVMGLLLPVSALHAEGEVKALPTLLIKGEIVSIDTTDVAATLIKVKDRYGFETPIYLQAETKIVQGDAALAPNALASGSPVEVEYNFDVNTAKRHAVSVKVAAPAAAEAAPAAPAPEAAPAVSAPAMKEAAPAAAETAPAADETASPPAESTAPVEAGTSAAQ